MPGEVVEILVGWAYARPMKFKNRPTVRNCFFGSIWGLRNRFLLKILRPYLMQELNISAKIIIGLVDFGSGVSGIGVARAFPGGRVAHLKDQNSLRKNKKN